MEKPISVVIPFKSDVEKDYRELFYSLRSLQSKLKMEIEVFVCGDKINSLHGLNYITCKDEKGKGVKERNIYRKILAACHDERVSDDFIFTNDDIFLLKEFSEIPYYHKGELMETMKKANMDYRASLNHSRKYLISKGKPTLDYDTHFPIVYNKRKFIDTFANEAIDFDQPFGYVIKSIYCNMNYVSGIYGGDCKIKHPKKYKELLKRIEGKEFFSTSDGCMNEAMIELLNELYENRSNYEK